MVNPAVKKSEWYAYIEIHSTLKTDEGLFECQYSEEEKQSLLDGVSSLKEQLTTILDDLFYFQPSSELIKLVIGFVREYIAINIEVKKMLRHDEIRVLKRQKNKKQLEELEKATLIYRKKGKEIVAFEDWFYRFEHKEYRSMVRPLEKYDDLEAKKRNDEYIKLRDNFLRYTNQEPVADDYMNPNWHEPWFNPKIEKQLKKQKNKILKKSP